MSLHQHMTLPRLKTWGYSRIQYLTLMAWRPTSTTTIIFIRLFETFTTKSTHLCCMHECCLHNTVLLPCLESWSFVSFFADCTTNENAFAEFSEPRRHNLVISRLDLGHQTFLCCRVNGNRTQVRAAVPWSPDQAPWTPCMTRPKVLRMIIMHP